MTVDDFLELFEAGEIAINFEDLANVEDAEAIIAFLVSKKFSAWTSGPLDKYIGSRFVDNKKYTLLICDTGGKCDMVAINDTDLIYKKFERKNIDWKDLTANILGVHYKDVSESDFDSVLKG